MLTPSQNAESASHSRAQARINVSGTHRLCKLGVSSPVQFTIYILHSIISVSCNLFGLPPLNPDLLTSVVRAHVPIRSELTSPGLFTVTDVGRPPSGRGADGPGAGGDGVPATAPDRVAAAAVGGQGAAASIPETARRQAPSSGGGARAAPPAPGPGRGAGTKAPQAPGTQGSSGPNQAQQRHAE